MLNLSISDSETTESTNEEEESNQPSQSSQPSQFSQSSQSTQSSGIWVSLGDHSTRVEFESFLTKHPFKLTSTHGNQRSRCTIHSNDKHYQTYSYYKCSSTKCFKESEDSCSFQLKVTECSFDHHVRVYQVGEHSNKYVNIKDNNRTGICAFFKAEIDNLLKDESSKKPFTILMILTRRKAEGKLVIFVCISFLCV